MVDRARILDLLAQGKTPAEVAEELGCHPATVRRVRASQEAGRDEAPDPGEQPQAHDARARLEAALEAAAEEGQEGQGPGAGSPPPEAPPDLTGAQALELYQAVRALVLSSCARAIKVPPDLAAQAVGQVNVLSAQLIVRNARYFAELLKFLDGPRGLVLAVVLDGLLSILIMRELKNTLAAQGAAARAGAPGAAPGA